MLGYKTQTDCCMLVFGCIYSTGDGVRCFKIWFHFPATASILTGLGGACVVWLSWLAAQPGELSVSSTALSTAHPHFYPLCTVALLSVVLLTLVLCYLDDEMLAPRNRWCDDHRAQFTALFLLRFPAQSYLALYGQPGDYLSLPFQGHRLLFFKSHDLKIFFWKGYIKIKVWHNLTTMVKFWCVSSCLYN